MTALHPVLHLSCSCFSRRAFTDHRFKCWGDQGRRGTKEVAIEGAAKRPGCGLMFRGLDDGLTALPYRSNRPLHANPTSDPKALFHRTSGNGGASAPGPRADSPPTEGRKTEREREVLHGLKALYTLLVRFVSSYRGTLGGRKTCLLESVRTS